MSQLLHYAGTVEAVLTLLAVGSLLGVSGLPVVLTGRTFTSLVLASAAGLGGVVGHVTGFPVWLTAFAFALATLAVLELLPARLTGPDGVLAVVYIAMTAAATLLVSKLPGGDVDLLGLQFGNILALPRASALRTAVLAAAGLAAAVATQRRILAAAGDQTCARLAGMGPRLALAGHSLLLAMAVTLGLDAFGVIPVCAGLVVPGFIALRLSRTRAGWIVVAMLIVAVTTVVGLVGSFALDFPPGVFIAGLMAAAATVVWFMRR